jgi:hypothetical protein
MWAFFLSDAFIQEDTTGFWRGFGASVQQMLHGKAQVMIARIAHNGKPDSQTANLKFISCIDRTDRAPPFLQYA